MKALILRIAFWLHDFILGGTIRNHYKSVESGFRKKISSDIPLKDLLRFATENCSFYKPHKNKDLANFPVIDKITIRERMNEFVILEANNPWQKSGHPYYVQKTSGSTGIPFSIPQDSRKRNRRLAELKFFGKRVGFNSHELLVQLRIWTNWQSKGRWQSFKENIIPFDCSNLSDTRLEQLVSLITKTRAVCVRAYASSFAVIADFLKRTNRQIPSVRVMIAGSEALLDSTRRLISETCPNCCLISQYANEEAGILAQEEPGIPGVFYLNRASYIFEVLKIDSDEPASPGEVGRLIITDLYNFACPLIRYDTGDLCSFDIDEHTGEMVITKLFGRRLDLVYNTKREPIFPMYFARVLKNYDSILQWQFIQKEKKLYVLKLTLTVAINDFSEQWADIYEQFLILLGDDAVLQAEYVDDIPVLKSGKRKACVQQAACYGS